MHRIIAQVEPLDRRHDRESFDCGEQSLNRYLKQQAAQDMTRHIGTTHVAVPALNETRIAGYYTLAMSSVGPGALPEKNLPSRIPMPAVLLGRLAVDLTFKGEGLGEYLLMDALARSERVALSEVGAVAVVVDALPHAVGFYARYGFKSLPDDTAHLYLPMTVIHKLRLNER